MRMRFRKYPTRNTALKRRILLGASQWIGHQGLHRNPLAKSYRSRHSENGHHSAILRSQRSFYTCATGQEACDWPSQNEAVQLSTEKAAGTSVIENNRENGPKWCKNGLKCNKRERK